MGIVDDLVWMVVILCWLYIGLFFLLALTWELVITISLTLLLMIVVVGVIGLIYFLPCMLNKHPFWKVSVFEKGEWIYRYHECNHCGKQETREMSSL